MYRGDELSERKKLILKAIIDAHIENGEPVGSKYLTKGGGFTYSASKYAARAVMEGLEQACKLSFEAEKGARFICE